MELLYQLFPNVMENLPAIYTAFIETMQMLLISGIFSAFFGILLGILLVVCRKGGIMECMPVWWIFDKLVNLFRCIPFMLLVAMMFEVTRALVGTTVFVRGSIPPLVVGTIPFFSRQVEAALLSLDPGLIEASQAMGDSPLQTILRVYLKESIPGIVRGTSITLIALIGYTTICGAYGAGGLGQFAYDHGYVAQHQDVTYFIVLILLLITTLIQSISEHIYRKTSH